MVALTALAFLGFAAAAEAVRGVGLGEATCCDTRLTTTCDGSMSSLNMSSLNAADLRTSQPTRDMKDSSGVA